MYSSTSGERLNLFSPEQTTLPPPHHQYSTQNLLFPTSTPVVVPGDDHSVLTNKMPVSGSLAELKARLCLREQ